ncbi:uncharacterized protein L201_004199 [Kwoniella dendrophila CBS 6074]|uniref:Uncharacterized protein n=1 Tax=Kwoniella dendrophila CBS 6074 TaxID=1295534 RepID=A0AAX4JXM3_9TREE
MPTNVTSKKEAWNDEHTLILLREMAHSLLINRSTFYSTPGLKGVNEHGGDRINKKIQQLLKSLCCTIPGGEKLVEEVLKEMKTKNKINNNGSPGKKRKIKD